MSKIIVLGDLHIRDTEPFYSVSKNFFEWFIKQEWNNEENILIQLGDILDHSVVNGKVNYLMMDMFFNKLKFNKIYVVTGNHDYSKNKGNGLLPLKVNSKIQLITEIDSFQLFDYQCLFIPYYYSHVKLIDDLRKLEEKNQVDYDFIFGHIADETQTIFDNYVDLSAFKGNRIFGHIHNQNGNYLGAPYVIRYDERNTDKYIGIIESFNFKMKKLPIFFDYDTLSFGEKPDNNDYITMYDIVDAPDKESVYKIYSDLYIRNIELKQSKIVINNKDNRNANLTLKEYLFLFLDTNNITGELKNKLIETIN